MLLTKSFLEFWGEYFGNRRFPKDQEFYVVYTSTDHAIPFYPDSARNYWLINFELNPTVFDLGYVLARKSFAGIRRTYVELARESSLCFRQVPTIMPHFYQHRARALRAAQTLLKPINCCPSLHTATPFYFFNVGIAYFPEREAELRQYIGAVISAVISTKLHALVDVAFGMLLCKQTLNRKLGLGFNNLETFFTQEQKRRDNIPYEIVYKMYRDIEELSKADGYAGNLPKVMERYFQEMGLPRVTRDESNCMYDIENKKLVYYPEFRVGGGMF